MVDNEGGLYDRLYTVETTTSDDAGQERDGELQGINKFEMSSAATWY